MDERGLVEQSRNQHSRSIKRSDWVSAARGPPAAQTQVSQLEETLRTPGANKITLPLAGRMQWQKEL